MNTMPVAFWLVPCDADRIGPDGLQTRIDALATAHGACRFGPHITLHLDEVPADVDLAGILASVAADHPPVLLRAGPTAHSDQYFQTLTVEFPANGTGPAEGLALDGPVVEGKTAEGQTADEVRAGQAMLRRLQQAIARGLRRGDDGAADEAATREAVAAYPMRPHLSLLYARIDAGLRAGLAAREQMAGRLIRFDTLAAVRPAAGFGDIADVDRWEVFGHTRLRGVSPFRR